MSDVVEPNAALAVIPASAISKIAEADTDGILADLARKVAAHKGDATTAKGRDEIRSLAFQVRKTKAALDKLGLGLTEGYRKATAAVNAERKISAKWLDELHDKVRGPLDEFEAREAARVQAHEGALKAMDDATYVEPGASSETIRATLAAFLIRPDRDWQEFTERAASEFQAGVLHLETLLASTKKREVEAAELAQLRAERAAREAEEQRRAQAERERQVAAEAAEKARLEAEAERDRIIAEERMRAAREAEQQRQEVERLQQQAKQAEQDRIEAEARAERDRIAAAERAEAARIAAEQQAQREQQAAIEAERKRVADEKAAQDAEDARRAANKAHRLTIAKAVLEDLSAFVVVNAVNPLFAPPDPELVTPILKQVVNAISIGAIRHTRIEY